MGRIYIESTPASRGEAVEEPEHSFIPEGMSEEEFVELLAAAADELGYRLVAVEEDAADDTEGDDKPDGEQGDGDTPPPPVVDEPAGNASTEDWVAYAKAKGAQPEDLVDEQGEPLGQRALRAKFGTPTGS